MAYDFNDDTAAAADEKPPEKSTPDAPADAAAAPAVTPAGAPTSPALTRFRSCRWQQPPENGSTEFCTHREVKPYAGTTGFDADAWCPDCQYYKLRRAPKKKTYTDDYAY